ncbi:hypothetical protein CXX78_00655 [Candidatus Parvarchaeota archaeon]|nr:MAG: hypothetical protein CXX78_01615 [Candidatus Parvarchaeota archaeon]PXY71507.1 MAG: hypothetical protein CXX78_00655 [Candidatus Parvarchaeota archaeon]
MLPRWHIFWGLILSIFIWFFHPEIKIIYLLLVFLSSFLIDFDHYLVAVKNTKSLSLQKAFNYFALLGKNELNRKKKKRKKDPLMIFHTAEFHLLVLAVGFLEEAFLFIFLGMFFHSLLDIIWLIKNDRLHKREYFLINWLRDN